MRVADTPDGRCRRPAEWRQLHCPVGRWKSTLTNSRADYSFKFYFYSFGTTRQLGKTTNYPHSTPPPPQRSGERRRLGLGKKGKETVQPITRRKVQSTNHTPPLHCNTGVAGIFRRYLNIWKKKRSLKKPSWWETTAETR